MVRTRVPGPEEQATLQAGKLQAGFEGGVLMTHKQLYLECGDGSILQILEVSVTL